MKAPSSNIQAPEKHQVSSAIFWSLKFGISLVLGAWNLELKNKKQKQLHGLRLLPE
jgi:hypothetical protein